ncbi:cupredoxin domain-containing protein [Trinickia sp. LjRoot230]|uniref:cupredoxin domain-containing protein n=1 Tax=Trinickia sp. LjRoot230 TaxID=3342288 RepID=UPI003F5004F6
MRRTTPTLFVGVAVVIGGLWAGTALAHKHTMTIDIDAMQFNPATVTVAAGDEVVWVNKDLVAHTVVAPGRFDSHEIAPGHAWHYVTGVPGRYSYACSLHPIMKGTLVVERK